MGCKEQKKKRPLSANPAMRQDHPHISIPHRNVNTAELCCEQCMQSRELQVMPKHKPNYMLFLVLLQHHYTGILLRYGFNNCNLLGGSNTLFKIIYVHFHKKTFLLSQVVLLPFPPYDKKNVLLPQTQFSLLPFPPVFSY